jgi:hypothetical protein
MTADFTLSTVYVTMQILGSHLNAKCSLQRDGSDKGGF